MTTATAPSAQWRRLSSFSSSKVSDHPRKKEPHQSRGYAIQGLKSKNASDRHLLLSTSTPSSTKNPRRSGSHGQREGDRWLSSYRSTPRHDDFDPTRRSKNENRYQQQQQQQHSGRNTHHIENYRRNDFVVQTTHDSSKNINNNNNNNNNNRMGKGYDDRTPRNIDRREGDVLVNGRADANRRHQYEYKGNKHDSQRWESSSFRNRSFRDHDCNDYRYGEEHWRRSMGSNSNSNSNSNHYENRTGGMYGGGTNRQSTDYYRDPKDHHDIMLGTKGSSGQYPLDLKQEHFDDYSRDSYCPQPQQRQPQPQRPCNATSHDDDSYHSRYSLREEEDRNRKPVNNRDGNHRSDYIRNEYEHNGRALEQQHELYERQKREDERWTRAKEDEQFRNDRSNRIGEPPRVRAGELGQRDRNEREFQPHQQQQLQQQQQQQQQQQPQPQPQRRNIDHREREPQGRRSGSFGLISDSSNRNFTNNICNAMDDKLTQVHNGSHHHQGKQDGETKIDTNLKRRYSDSADDSVSKGRSIESPPNKRHREGCGEATFAPGMNASNPKETTAAQPFLAKPVSSALANTSVSQGTGLKRDQHGQETEGNQKQGSKIPSTGTQKTTTTASLKPNSSSSTKAHAQKQMPAKTKVTNKLGIPMRWLKPKAKLKPVKMMPPPAPKPEAFEVPKKKSAPSHKPPSPSNRLVTDSSEGSSSIVSSRSNSTGQITKSTSKMRVTKKPKGSSVPAAIVTKPTQKEKGSEKSYFSEHEDESVASGEEWDSDAESEPDESDGSDSERDADEEEVLHWASKMLGVNVNSPSAGAESNGSSDPDNTNDNYNDFSKPKSPKLKIRLSSALKIKLSESIKSSAANSTNLSEEDNKKIQAALKKLERKKKRDEKLKALSEKINDQPEFDHEKVRMEIEEDRRKREEGRPLTAKEIRRILREDKSSGGGDTSNWVRRSRRQPSMALLNSKPVRFLVEKLKNNDTDMRVLKMKKYINDPNAPCAVLDAILGAMEENTNCEALYIQNFNEGMRDQQVLHLLRILQQSSCKIWCLNIGENYNVSDETWEKFTKGLIHTKITHMYASEHTITTDMKDEIRFTIRENRKKHDLHINPNNLDVIIQCTHCWWNPINAKVLRPYLKKRGYEHMLKDKEAQGLQGSTSMAPSK